MNWIFFAILSPAIYALVNFVDKHLVTNKVRDFRAMPIYTSIVATFAGILFWILTGFPILGARDAGIVIFTGMIAIWSTFLYFRALSKEDTTTIIILFQTVPVLTLIFGYFILGETISLKQFIGFLIIIIAALGVTFKPHEKGQKILSEAFFLMLAYNVMWALSGVLIKFAINATSFASILSYESFGIALGGALVFFIFPGIRKHFFDTTRQITTGTYGILFFNEALFVIAKSLAFYAFVLGPVALVNVLSSTQVFFGIFYGLVLTLLFPKLFKENISLRGLAKKAFFAAIMVVGIYFLV